jgi:hypothetical protein
MSAPLIRQTGGFIRRAEIKIHDFRTDCRESSLRQAAPKAP